MILDSTLKSLQLVLGEGKSTVDCDITANWADQTPNTFLATNAALHSNGTTAVTVVPAPGTLTQRQVPEIRLFNNDSISHHVTLELNSNSTLFVVDTAVVGSGAEYLYTPQTSGQTNSSGGTVTQVNTSGAGISGGPITTSGTLTVEWNAGTVTALDPTQLQLTTGTLQLITGPTILAHNQTAAIIISSNTSTAWPTLGAATPMALIGADNSNIQLEQIAVAGTIAGSTGASGNIFGRINGTFASPSALNSGDRIGAVNIRGYGTSYVTASPAWEIFAGSTWSGTNLERYQVWSNISAGSATVSEKMRLTSAGALLVGTTVAVGSELLNINGSFVMGGTASAGGTIKVTGSSAPISITDGVTAFPTILRNTVLEVAGTAAPRLTIDAFAGAGQMSLRRTNGTQAAPTAVSAGNPIGTVQGFGYDGTSWSTLEAASSQMLALNNWTTADHSAYLAWFATNSGSLTSTEKMRLTGGALLVGTTAATGSELLNVAGAAIVQQSTRSVVAASAGAVGEYISQSVTSGSAVALTSGSVAAIGSIVINGTGDFDLYGMIALTGTSTTTVTQAQASINTTGTVLGTTLGLFTNNNFGGVALSGEDLTANIIGARVTAAGTYFLNTKVTFAVGTLSAYGLIEARRR